jgi:hypothetical protein
MIRLRLILLALVLLAIALPLLLAEGQNTATVCHRLAGSLSAQTMAISPEAVPAHLAHGDTLGACPLSPSQ